MTATTRYSYISLKRLIRSYVDTILYLNIRFETIRGRKKGKYSPSGDFERKKGYSNPFFPNFPTDFLFGMGEWWYDHMVDDILCGDAAAFCLSVLSLPGPCIKGD